MRAFECSPGLGGVEFHCCAATVAHSYVRRMEKERTERAMVFYDFIWFCVEWVIECCLRFRFQFPARAKFTRPNISWDFVNFQCAKLLHCECSSLTPTRLGKYTKPPIHPLHPPPRQCSKRVYSYQFNYTCDLQTKKRKPTTWNGRAMSTRTHIAPDLTVLQSGTNCVDIRVCGGD